ncbi:MAG TPA: hypothetical protein VI775_02135 [Candidatus Paceibacterota bacterium]
MEQNQNVILPGIWQLIKQAWSLYKRNYKILIAIGLIPLVFSLILNIFGTFSKGFNPLLIGGVIVILGLISWVIQLTSQISYIKAISELDSGSTTITVSDIYKRSFNIFLPFLWVSILSMLAVMGAYVFLIIPGVILTIYLMFSTYFMVIENKKGLSALSTSQYYMKNNWWGIFWRVFGPVLIIMLILLGLSAILLIIIAAISHPQGLSTNLTDYNSLLASVSRLKASTGLISLIFSSIFTFLIYCIIAPIGTAYTYLIYKNLKQMKPEPTEEDLKTSKSWMKGLSIFGFVVVIGIILLSIFSVAFFGFMKMQKGFNNYQTQNQFQSGSSINTNIDIDGEKKYDQYGFSIDIPDNLISQGSSVEFNTIELFLSNSKEDSYSPSLAISIYGNSVDANIPSEEYRKLSKEIYENDAKNNGIYFVYKDGGVMTNQNNVKVYYDSYSLTNNSGKYITEKMFYFFNRENIIEIIWQDDPNSFSETVKEFDKIIQTVKVY